MEKEFIPHKLAFELKELGYDEPCLMYWYEASNGYVLVNKKDQTFQPYTNAPLYQQAFRWFREKYGYNCFVTSSILDGKWYYFRENLNDREDDSEPELTPKFDTYEEAELECLKKLIEIVKNK
jgi:hypothetical protein